MAIKRFKKIFAILLLTVSNSAYASSYSLESSTTYSISGSGLGQDTQFANAGGVFLAFYQNENGNPAAVAGDMYGYFDLSGTLSTGTISGSNLSGLDVRVTANLVSLVRYDGTNWNAVNGAVGSVSSHIAYTNLTINGDRDILALVNGAGSGSGTIRTSLSYENYGALQYQNAEASFMPFDSTSQGYYDPAINAFSNTGVLDFAMAGFNGSIHSWFNTTTPYLVGGNSYFLQGDIHASYASQVPEPASMCLLTAGLFGVINRKKKSKSA